MTTKDEASQLISIFDNCSNATEDLVYFRREDIGKVVWLALAMRRDIGDLENRIERLKEQLTTKS